MTSHLIDLLNRCGRPRLAVVGDLMLDQYVWGEVERISPEAPIQVLRVSRRDHRVGGAGSVAVNLARLGCEVHVFSTVGGDGAGEQVRALLQAEGCRTDGVLSLPERRTTVKTRHLGYVQHADRAVQQMLRVDEEDLVAAGEAEVTRFIGELEGGRSLDAVLVSDYAKGLVTRDLVRRVCAAAGGAPVLADPARIADYSRYEGVRLVCPNRYEAHLASGVGCADLEGCRRASDRLLERHGFEAVALTVDREGILLARRGAGVRHFPTRASVVADVTGAGDMVLSVLGLVVAAGGTLEEAVELANVAAGIEIRTVGVTPVSRDELLQELRYLGHPAAGKLKSLGELAAAVRAARAAGRCVVFTNGCFDLLHPGHHHLLNGARREGDLLIVAVNSDASVRRLKGPGRPIIGETDRVMMLAGLEAVDLVTVFDEDTPERLLRVLRPDVLVKGSEYREGVVVGREIVEGYGGRVAFVEQLRGISTSALLGESGSREPP